MSLFVFSQNHSDHKQWKLEGADQRISEIRKGDLNLEFITDLKIDENSNSSINLKLVNHDFKFGVSFTQLRRFWGQDYGDLYLKRFKEVFNYATIGMYWQLTDERSNSKFMDNYYKGILDWSEKNDIRLKGHPLMWHEAMPNWVRNFKNIEELNNSSTNINNIEIISDDKINTLSTALLSFKYTMEVHGVEHYKIYATSALRDSKNSNDVIKQIYDLTGMKIKLIDGLKEAKVIAMGNPIEKLDFDKTYLYVDVGGGSTEYSIVRRGDDKKSKSFNIGNSLILPSFWANFKYSPGSKFWSLKQTKP